MASRRKDPAPIMIFNLLPILTKNIEIELLFDIENNLFFPVLKLPTGYASKLGRFFVL
jgi:hypothetical protein